MLSKTQPFLDKTDKIVDKKQYMHVIKKPFLVTDNDFKELPTHINSVEESFLNNDDVKSIFQNTFIKQILPKLKMPIGVYDGCGLTEQDILKILERHKEKADKLAQKWFNEFKSCTTEEQITDFFNDREKDKYTHVRANERLNELIQNYDKKYK